MKMIKGRFVPQAVQGKAKGARVQHAARLDSVVACGTALSAAAAH